MSWLKKSDNTFKLEGIVSMSVPTETTKDSPLFALSVSRNTLAEAPAVTYPNGNPFELAASANDTSTVGSESTEDDGWAIDIAQSHHFTVEIKDAPGHKSGSGNLLSYRTPNNVYSHFLPVKNMSLAYTSYENMSIPVSIFGDFPLLQRRRVETINLVCYDEDTHQLEHNLHLWSNECFPMGKYVAYMDDVVKELIYRGYTVDGRESLYIRRFVIPTGQVHITRDYSENEAKMISFSLACVGDGSTCATGNPSRVAGSISEGTGAGASAYVTQEEVYGKIVGETIGDTSNKGAKSGKRELKDIPTTISAAKPRYAEISAAKPRYAEIKADNRTWIEKAAAQILWHGVDGFLH